MLIDVSFSSPSLSLFLPQAAFMVMAHLGGKLLVFQTSAPSLGIGKVKNRDVANLYNTGGCRVRSLGFKPILTTYVLIV